MRTAPSPQLDSLVERIHDVLRAHPGGLSVEDITRADQRGPSGTQIALNRGSSRYSPASFQRVSRGGAGRDRYLWRAVGAAPAEWPKP